MLNSTVKYSLCLLFSLSLSCLFSVSAFPMSVQPPIDGGTYKVGFNIQRQGTDHDYNSVTATTVQQGFQVTNEYGLNEYITGGFQFGLSSLNSGKFISGTDQFNTDGDLGFGYGPNITLNYLDNYWGMDWFLDWQYRKLNSDLDNGTQELVGQGASVAWYIPVQGIHTTFGLQYERSEISIDGTSQEGSNVTLDGNNSGDVGVFLLLQSNLNRAYQLAAQGSVGNTLFGEVGLKRVITESTTRNEKSGTVQQTQTEDQESRSTAESDERASERSDTSQAGPERLPRSNWKEQFNKGVTHYRNQKYRRALERFSEAHSARPEVFELKAWLATTHFELKNYEQAKKYLQQALQERPDYEYGRKLLVKIERVEGRMELPEETTDTTPEESRAGQASKVSVQTLIDSGNRAVRNGQLNQARKFYEQARKREPQNITIHSNLGSLHYRNGDYAKALKSYQRALDIKPDDVKTNLFLGLTFYRLDRSEPARRHFQRVLDLAPGSKAAQKAKQWLRRLD